MKKTKKKISTLLKNCEKSWPNFCRCGVSRQICFGLENIFELEQIDSDEPKLKTYKLEIMKELRNCVSKGRELITKLNICTHDENDLNTIFEKVIKPNTDDSDKTYDYVIKQTKKIKKNASRIFVAPGEGGAWKSWQTDLFLEEKLFPVLFPYGIGGYMSSNMLRENDMGFANYVKNRIMSADPKFRNDPSYLFFLLLVKEMVDMKRSKQT